MKFNLAVEYIYYMFIFITSNIFINSLFLLERDL